MNLKFPIRINKYLAIHNYATRGGADLMIEKGLVFINGRKAVLGDKVEKNDSVEVDPKHVKKDYFYYAYNKSEGIVTNSPTKVEKGILNVTKFPHKVFPIGRLDKDSHGLIILTNDGRITDRLLSPKYVHEKEYIVKTERPFNDDFIQRMGNGVRFDGFVSRKTKVWREDSDTFSIILTEGKKRQIRRMCEALHYDVIDLKRIRIMNIELGKIKKGEFKEIKGKELKDFLNLLGILS